MARPKAVHCDVAVVVVVCILISMLLCNLPGVSCCGQPVSFSSSCWGLEKRVDEFLLSILHWHTVAALYSYSRTVIIVGPGWAGNIRNFDFIPNRHFNLSPENLELYMVELKTLNWFYFEVGKKLCLV